LEFERRSELAAANARVRQLADIAAEHVRQIVATIDLGLAALAIEMSETDVDAPAARSALHEKLVTTQRVSPAIQGVGFIGRDGYVQVSSNSAAPSSVNLADRDYFVQLRGDSGSGLWIGKPIVTLPENIVSIPIARRVSGPNGEFLGVAAARLDPAYFSRFFAAVGVDTVAVSRADGAILARLPDGDLFGPDGPVASVLARDAEMRGRLLAVDGVEQISAFRRIEAYPLFVQIGLGRDAWLAAWRSWRDATAAVFAVIVVSGTLALRVHLRRRQEARFRQRAEAERAAELEHRRYPGAGLLDLQGMPRRGARRWRGRCQREREAGGEPSRESHGVSSHAQSGARPSAPPASASSHDSQASVAGYRFRRAA